jgi:hypothetical protein
MAETRFKSQGLAATGVGTVDCARHNMKRPNGVGDLQKGEKCDFIIIVSSYSNQLDQVYYIIWISFSSQRYDTFFLNVSYDIACQWHKNLCELSWENHTLLCAKISPVSWVELMARHQNEVGLTSTLSHRAQSLWVQVVVETP